MAKKPRELYDQLLQICQWKLFPKTPKSSVGETEVKSAVLAFFRRQGYKVDPSPDTGPGGYDIVCYHEEKKRWWIIEAKGASGNLSVDFPQCMGQLLLTMHHGQMISASYGIAVPDTDYFTLRHAALPEQLRSCLQWHWFFVSSLAQVRFVEPPGCQCLEPPVVGA